MKRIIKICMVLAAAAVLGLGTASCKHGHGGGGGGGGPVYTPGGGGSSPAAPGGTAPRFISSDATTDYTTPTTPTTLEQAVLNEMNFARTQPQEYVTQRLEPLKTTPNIHVDWSTTGTFLTTLQECIDEMNAMSPISALQWGGRLRMSAMEWVIIQGAGTELEDHGHDPNLSARIHKYCTLSGDWSAGENIAYGNLTPQEWMIGLLVDDGIPSRGHRVNILGTSPSAAKFTHVGIAIGPHGYWTKMGVMNFAGGYTDVLP